MRIWLKYVSFRIITKSKHLSSIHPDAFRNMARLRFLWVLSESSHFYHSLSLKTDCESKIGHGWQPYFWWPAWSKTLFFNELGSPVSPFIPNMGGGEKSFFSTKWLKGHFMTATLICCKQKKVLFYVFWNNLKVAVYKEHCSAQIPYRHS